MAWSPSPTTQRSWRSPSHAAQQAELRGAGVLELVDVQVAEPPALRVGERLVALERVGAPGDQVVEVDEPALALLALVGTEDLGDLVGGPWWVAPRLGRGARVAVGGDQPGLGPLDLGRDVGGGQSGLAAAPTDDRQEHAHLALEQGGHRAPGVVDAAAQLRERDRVERAGGDVVLHAEPARAVTAARRPPCA